MTDLAEIPVIGVGYSAGGLDAARILLSNLPTDTGTAYVIIQHLQPDAESHLPEILGRSTKMPTLAIESGTTIQPNTVYVLPPGYDVVINGNFLNLCPRRKSEIHPLSIDFFFTSLAQSRKSRAIGVVLSGTGADGTLGMKAIKVEGGITIVQDPKTAKFDSMPRSAIASGIADLILTPDAIALEISRLAKHPYTKATLQSHLDSSHAPEPVATVDEASSYIGKILDIILKYTQVDLTQYKSSTIRRRIERQMMLRKIETIEKYAECLQKDPDEVKALYEDIFIHVTDFFRDPDSFNALREKAFPELVKGKSKTFPVRIWVPGCATGEEVYSLAISLIEYLEENKLNIPISIFASDISEPALQKARKGVYASHQMRSVSAERLTRFFDPVKDGYKIKKDIRDLCVFSRHDVTSNPPIPRVDLISCRNVLIYFSTDLQKRLFPLFNYSLNESGFLWLGRAENPETNSKLFEAVDKTHKIFAKARGAFPGDTRFLAPSYMATSLGAPEIVGNTFRQTTDLARSADQLILFRYSPPCVLINANDEILQFRGRTIPYLEPSPGVASHNLMKMANPDIATALRVCVQAAKKQNVQVRKEGIEFEVEGRVRKANIDVTPLNPGLPAKERQYLVVFEDASTVRIVKSRARRLTGDGTKKDVQSQFDALAHFNAQLQQEVEAAREYQQSLIEEYESSQEELTSANEELRSMNEELQSTNEELHSTNEELGSAKEELQSANEELLSTNEELHRRNYDLEIAFREVAASERRFQLLVESVKDYAIYRLDPEGYVRSWNSGAKRINGYQAEEIIGCHFSRFYTAEDIARDHPNHELRVAMQQGRYEEQGWRVRRDGSRFWANVTITRIDDEKGEVTGFAKVTRDLTEQKKAEELRLKVIALQEAERTSRVIENERANFRNLFKQTPEMVCILYGPDHVFEFVNEAHIRVLGFDATGMAVRKAQPESVEVHGILDEVYRTGKTAELHEIPVTVTDRLRYFNLTYAARRDEAGVINGIMILGIEVTDQVASRTALQEAILSRDEFLSIASHELKTPITSLQIQAQLRKRNVLAQNADAFTFEKLGKMFDGDRAQIERLNRLIDDMLDVTRITSNRLQLRLEKSELSAIVKEVLERLAPHFAAANCKVIVEEMDECFSMLDRFRIEQVVVNLLTNAIRYGNCKPVHVSLTASNGHTQLKVRDEGVGIAGADHQRIFDRFERATRTGSETGLGLGLYISREIVQMHQGKIRVESDLGHGATFIVELPLLNKGEGSKS